MGRESSAGKPRLDFEITDGLFALLTLVVLGSVGLVILVIPFGIAAGIIDLIYPLLGSNGIAALIMVGIFLFLFLKKKPVVVSKSLLVSVHPIVSETEAFVQEIRSKHELKISKRVEDVAAAIRVFLALDATICRPLVESTAIEMAQNRKFTAFALNRGIRIEEQVLVIIMMSVSKLLHTGRYHAQPGLLNSEGFDMHRLWKVIVSKLRTVGYYSDEAEATEQLAWMESKIKEMGPNIPI